jgi:GGDEF domain-containing protein
MRQQQPGVRETGRNPLMPPSSRRRDRRGKTLNGQPHHLRKTFLGYEEEARKRITALGVTPEQIEALREFGLLACDSVTGFHEGRSGTARIATLRQVIRHVRQTGERAFYVEMDVRNLGGLNAALGHSRANEVYSAIAALIRNELSSVASEAAFFRHGGDEMSAFLVNTTEQAVRAGLERVHRGVAKLAKDHGVHDIPNPKHRRCGRCRGIGLHIGMTRIASRHEDDPTLVFQEADVAVERRKRTETARSPKSSGLRR